MDYKVGDFVKVQYRSKWHIGKIARVTPKQVVLTSWERYWRESGSKVGADGWHQRTISPATEGDIEELKKKRIVNQLVGVDLSILPLATLEELLKTIQEIKSEI